MGMITCGSIICFGKIFYQCTAKERKNVLTIIVYILLFALFCTLYEQAGTSLMLFYEKAVDRTVMGMAVPSSFFLSLDPLFVLLCGPALLWLSKKYFEKTTSLHGFVKIGCGFLCVAASFEILALSTFYSSTSLVSPLWIMGAMLIQTIGELWIAPITFSKISQYAPPRFKSILMSFWSMAIAYGHYLAGFVAQFSLNDAPSLAAGNSLEGYQVFFTHLTLLPLCVALSLLLFHRMKCGIMLKKRKVF
jgi:POT family proton-dependent oligopeptide transporter